MDQETQAKINTLIGAALKLASGGVKSSEPKVEPNNEPTKQIVKGADGKEYELVPVGDKPKQDPPKNDLQLNLFPNDKGDNQNTQPLTMETIAQMSEKEINENWDAVSAVISTSDVTGQ